MCLLLWRAQSRYALRPFTRPPQGSATLGQWLGAVQTSQPLLRTFQNAHRGCCQHACLCLSVILGLGVGSPSFLTHCAICRAARQPQDVPRKGILVPVGGRAGRAWGRPEGPGRGSFPSLPPSPRQSYQSRAPSSRGPISSRVVPWPQVLGGADSPTSLSGYQLPLPPGVSCKAAAPAGYSSVRGAGRLRSPCGSELWDSALCPLPPEVSQHLISSQDCSGPSQLRD